MRLHGENIKDASPSTAGCMERQRPIPALNASQHLILTPVNGNERERSDRRLVREAGHSEPQLALARGLQGGTTNRSGWAKRIGQGSAGQCRLAGWSRDGTARSRPGPRGATHSAACMTRGPSERKSNTAHRVQHYTFTVWRRHAQHRTIPCPALPHHHQHCALTALRSAG